MQMTNEQIDALFHQLVDDFSKHHPLMPQVVQELLNRQQVTSDQIEGFFKETLQSLEDWTIDLIFSPQFTPTLEDKAPYANILQNRTLSNEQCEQIKAKVLDKNLTIAFYFAEQDITLKTDLHDCFLDRYVDRLGLTDSISDSVLQHLTEIIKTVYQQSQTSQATPLTQTEAMGLALASVRNKTWQKPEIHQILEAYLIGLQAFLDDEIAQQSELPPIAFNLHNALLHLVDFVKTYRPEAIADIPKLADSLIKSCERDMETVGSQGFHDEYLKNLYAQNEVTTGKSDEVWQHYYTMIQQANYLKHIVSHAIKAMAKASV
ncbi:MAG: hypothetical protein AAGI66_00180 [Cyanobacteria bacterium P01_H01_bin.74]